jgi:hypothetical protein
VAALNLDALVTATEAAASPALNDICRHLIGMWKYQGKLTVRAVRGRSPLYRYGDVIEVERQTRRSGFSHREECKTCRDALERRVAMVA